MMNNVITINNLSFSYDKTNVLNNINLIVNKGEFLGIIGPNGSGKTTLLKIIAKILSTKFGEVLLFNKNIHSYSFEEYAKIISFATKITDYALQYELYDFMLLARYPFKNIDEFEIDSVLSDFQLTQFIKRKLSSLSSGELQRAIIAQCLIQKPKLLLLDEPTSHLDISHQIEILDKLKKMNYENNLTVVSSFHDLNLASEYCDKILIIKNGHILSFGKPRDIIKYDLIENVYKIPVIVKENPISKKPYVFPVPSMWKDHL